MNSDQSFSNHSRVDSILVRTIRHIEDIRQKNEDITGVPSGYAALDHVTYGWQNCDLIVLASRPSVGKTAFALNLARNAAMHPSKQTPVAIFSLEMSADQLVQRILAAESEVWLEKIARGKLEEHEMKQLYTRGIQRLAQAPLYIDDTPGLNILQLIKKCRELKNKHDIGLIIIDYLQLMNGVDEIANREQEISRIMRSLKALAKELQVPIIALSQLSREVEKRVSNTRIPQLSDLRDSGAIEQDADIVMFLYRPEYYDISINESGENVRGLTQIKIAKHRNGQLDTIKLKALLHIQKFVSWDQDPYSDIGLPTGSWRPVEETAEAKLFMQPGTKMNDIESNDTDDPFG